MEKNKKQVAKITVFITSIFIIFMSVSFAFINLTLQGTKRQVITAGTLFLELDEDENNLTIQNALPMYDDVGMIQDAFTFRLINKGTTGANYKLMLVEIGTGTLSKSDVKYGLVKDGVKTIGLLDDLKEGVIDSGTIGASPETIEYELRLWIKDSVTDNQAISGKSLSYRVDVEVGQIVEEIKFADKLEELVQESTATFPDFNQISSATNGRGIYKYKEDGVDIYYWRGNVAATTNSDNNVIFAGYCWQMVRTTKTGGIKMIYNGEVVDPILDENNEVIGGKCTNTGTATQLSGTTAFNSSYDDNAYVGYMYGLTGLTAELSTPQCIKLNSAGTAAEVGTETTEQACTEAGGKWATTAYEATHANVVNSAIKKKIDTWFSSSNLNTPENLEKIEDTVYCNDRSISGSGLGYGKHATNYMAYNRLSSSTTKIPSLECTNQNDRFTVNDTTNGNGALTYPVGLLTADEIALAGGVYDKTNSDYYLYNSGQNYWALSPYSFDGSGAYAFFVTSNGYPTDGYVHYSRWARPVISLVTGTNFADGGTGTKENPYVVE